jgi:acyl carrier protein
MEIKKFIKDLADQYDAADVNSINPETKFKEIEGYSSLIALSIIAMVDEEYNVNLKGDDIRNNETIGDLFNLIKVKM